ncbi:fas-binding factor 1 homolog isoform X2 [Stigmatopora nigra]
MAIGVFVITTGDVRRLNQVAAKIAPMMAAKPRGKSPGSSFRDGEQPVGRKLGRGGSRDRSFDIDDILSMLDDADLDEEAPEGPTDLNPSLKKTINSTAEETKQNDNKGFLPGPDFSSGIKLREEDEAAIEGKKKNPSVATNKKFSFSDVDDQDDIDDYIDLLDGLPQNINKRPSKSNLQLTKPDNIIPSQLVTKRETTSASKTLNEFTFDDAKDDLIDELGLDCENLKKKDNVLWSKRESDQPPRARTRLDEILENCKTQRLDWPPSGDKKEQPLSREKNYNIQEAVLENDPAIASYQPTVGDNASGHHSLRQSIRLPTEGVSAFTLDKKPPVNPSSTRPRNPADWLCLKADDNQIDLDVDTKVRKTSKDSPKSPSSPIFERKPSLIGDHNTSAAKMGVNASPLTDTKSVKLNPTKIPKKEEDDDDDWLTGALRRKKSLSESNFDAKISNQEQILGLGEEVDLESLVSKEVSSQVFRGRNKQLPTSKDAGLSAQSAPKREEKVKQVLPQPNLMPNTSAALKQQVPFSADSLQQLLVQQQIMQPQLLGLPSVLDVGAPRIPNEHHHHGVEEDLQARIIQLEGQAKTLQMERDHSQMLVTSMQQRYTQDMELMENTHKTRVKLLEESAAQRETRMRLETEDLIERLTALTQAAERERSELQAHYQRKLAQFQQEQDRDLERLRDLQWKSISEMKKDHEDHVSRLKKLKEEEIDAVTSATSETRSLTLVIEKMEHFSYRLGDLSSLVESRHKHTTNGLEQGTRHRDEQLQILQDRLVQQQKVMVEEKTYLKEIISRMDTQINEQQRQIEKERWNVTAEKAKVESSLKSLEEERRSTTMQMNMEREELERAKSALLEEQKAVMQQCTEERRKLAAEWKIFHVQEKQRRERVEQDVSTIMERREDSIMSLVQEQADLKLRSGELKLKETAVMEEREALEQLKAELDREKERISNTALKLKIRAQEVDAFSKLAAEKYEEGEQALQEAKHVEFEHQTRLRTIHSQIERLRHLEQNALEDRTRLNQQGQTQHKPEAPSGSLAHTSPILAGPALLDPKMKPTLNTSQIHNPQSVSLQASLAIWKYNSRRDHDYLEEQQIFLQNLKKKSCRQNTLAL